MNNQIKNIAASTIISALVFVPVFCNAQRVIYHNINDQTHHDQTLQNLKNNLIQIKGEIATLNKELVNLMDQQREARELILILQDICSEVDEYDIFYVGELDRVMTKDDLIYFIQNYEDLYQTLQDQIEQLRKSRGILINEYNYIMKQIETIMKNR